MKQEVTYEEWITVSDEGRLRFANAVYLKDGEKTQRLAPPTIGQMIEFLDEHSRPMVLTRHSQWHGDGWSINYTKEPPKSLTESAMQDALGLVANKELCDALWMACKEVLGEQ